MKPINFKEKNITFARDQKEYQPLPAFIIKGSRGVVISCWNLTLRERVKVLFTGRVWVSLLSFNRPLTPSYLFVDHKLIKTIQNNEIAYEVVRPKPGDNTCVH
jgi:hypothetical protein